MVDLIIILCLFFVLIYTISFIFNFKIEISDEVDVYVEPKKKTKYIKNQFINEYNYWLINSDYISIKNYRYVFPYTFHHYKHINELEWKEIFLQIKKQLIT
jgi:hypothetical protein